MSRAAIAVDVLIASPGDVVAEREVIEECILDWNANHSRVTGLVLTPRRWERDATPDLKYTGQEKINREVVRKADMLIGVFWSRMGTPTDRARSGTEEEINEFINSGKRCLLYFSTQHVPGDCDIEQIKLVRDFKKELMSKGLVASFSDLDNFRRQLNSHLNRAIQEEIIKKIDDKKLFVRGSFLSPNLRKSRSSWEEAYKLHRGSYLLYSYMQRDKEPDVCVSLVNIYGIDEAGIKFEMFNPQMRQERYGVYSYKGTVLPAGNRYMYIFADQIETNYEVFCAVFEYSSVNPPLHMFGHAIVVAVNAASGTHRTGSTGFMLRFMSRKRLGFKDLLGNKIGVFYKKDIDASIIEKIPKTYSKQ